MSRILKYAFYSSVHIIILAAWIEVFLLVCVILSPFISFKRTNGKMNIIDD